jgi:hypothetical protein
MKAPVALAVLVLACTPIAATAESQDDQMACMSDAFSICSHAIPDRDRVAACLSQNINRISPACRSVMARYSKPAPSPRSRITSVRD